MHDTLKQASLTPINVLSRNKRHVFLVSRLSADVAEIKMKGATVFICRMFAVASTLQYSLKTAQYPYFFGWVEIDDRYLDMSDYKYMLLLSVLLGALLHNAGARGMTHLSIR